MLRVACCVTPKNETRYTLHVTQVFSKAFETRPYIFYGEEMSRGSDRLPQKSVFLVSEVSHASEDHCDIVFVAGFDGKFVAH